MQMRAVTQVERFVEAHARLPAVALAEDLLRRRGCVLQSVRCETRCVADIKRPHAVELQLRWVQDRVRSDQREIRAPVNSVTGDFG